MTEDPIAKLVEGIVSDRAAREERLKGMVDQLVGRPAPSPRALPASPAPVHVSAPASPPLSPGPPPPVPPAAPAGPDPVERFREEIAALRVEKEHLAGKNIALYEELQRAQAAPPVKEDPPSAILDGLVVELREALAKEQAAGEAERSRASRLQEALKVRDAALADARRLLDEEQQVRIRLEVAHRAAEVQVRTLEDALRRREQALAERPAPPPSAPPPPPVAPPEPVRTPSDAAGQIQATRQAWLDAILKELAKR